MNMQKSFEPDKMQEYCPSDLAYKELHLLYEIAMLLGEYEDYAKALQSAMRLLKEESYFERCALFIANEEQTELTLFASVNLTEIQQKVALYKFGEGATGLAAQSREPVVIENIHRDITYLNKLGNLSAIAISYIAVPMIQKDQVIGVLSANITTKTPYSTDAIVHMLTIVGSIFTKTFAFRMNLQKEKEEFKALKHYYEHEIVGEHRFENIIGKSTKMVQIFDIIKTVAPTNATVLIRGETGTGKELIATAVHNLSERKHAPYVKLNCAAISESLLESELFGHEKGAFTDAKEMRKGRFELAHKGTLFLDEIGDISPSLQVKLLRVLQEQEFERVGGSKTIKVDVRIVTATNRNLEEMVSKGEFREDLYYRLNVIPINLPPLRERYEDIKLLIHHYLDQYTKHYKKRMALSKAAMELLLDYPWPGNIRELQNMMERLVLICPEGEVIPQMLNHVLPYNYQKLYMVDAEQPADVPEPVPASLATQPAPAPRTREELEAMEKEAIIQALEEHRGIQTKAAQQLGMTARQIGYKIKKYDIPTS